MSFFSFASKIPEYLFRKRILLIFSGSESPKRIVVSFWHYFLIYTSVILSICSLSAAFFFSSKKEVQDEEYVKDLESINHQLKIIKKELNLFSKYTFFAKHRMSGESTLDDKKNFSLLLNFRSIVKPLSAKKRVNSKGHIFQNYKEYLRIKNTMIDRISSHASSAIEAHSSLNLLGTAKNYVKMNNSSNILNLYDLKNSSSKNSYLKSSDKNPGIEYIQKLDNLILSIISLEESCDRLPIKSPIKNYSITSMFGSRIDPVSKNIISSHKGIDLKGKNETTKILASGSGIVKRAQFLPSYGYVVDIYHGNHILSRYAHMKSITTKVGQYIKSGSVIGYQGRTGRATGPHLHYEIRVNNVPINPLGSILASSKINSNSLVFNNNSSISQNEQIQ